jgi:hypothetical protein
MTLSPIHFDVLLEAEEEHQQDTGKKAKTLEMDSITRGRQDQDQDMAMAIALSVDTKGKIPLTRW